MKTLHRFGRLSLGLIALALLLAGCDGSTSQNSDTVPVTFTLTVPANTPADSEVWISGNQPELGDWNGHGVQLAKQADGTYSGSANFAPGTQLQWKATRGTWDTVEKGPDYEDVDNHTWTVTLHENHPTATIAHWREHTVVGTVKYHTINDTQFGLKPRDLIVWLPPGYDTNPDRHYPVLYMHDGQNLMDRLTSAFGSEWNVDETALRLINAGQMEPIIIVGVYNTADRIPEYTEVSDPQYGGGNADHYGMLLTQTIKPFIDANYRTKPEAQYTGLAGSSLGGLVSMYFGLTLNSTFSRIGVVSPSVWWANRDIVDRVNHYQGKPPLSRIWLDIGTNEGSTPQDEVNNTRLLRDALVAKGFTLDQDLKYLEVQGASHDEKSWSARIDQILMYLYPPVP